MKIWKVLAGVAIALGVGVSAFLLIAYGAVPEPEPDPYWECMAIWGYDEDTPVTSDLDVERLGEAGEACTSYSTRVQ